MGLQVILTNPQFALVNFPSDDTSAPNAGQTLFVPDVSYITKFSNGNLGIADAIMTNTLSQNLSSITNQEQLNYFLQSMNVSLKNPIDTYIVNGTLQVSSDDIVSSSNGSLSGLSAMEKAVFQSIFESQKPYMEIIKIVSESLIKIEDIIARVYVNNSFLAYQLEGLTGLELPLAMALANSKRPSGNPKALGYDHGNGVPTTTSLSQLDAIANMSSHVTRPTTDTTANPTSASTNTQIEYDILSTIYSTGTYDPDINYNYEYIDIYDDEIIEPIGSTYGIFSPPLYQLPTNVVFSIYDSRGSYLATEEIPDWLTQNPKWFGQFDTLSLTINNDDIQLYTNYYNNYINDKLISLGLSQSIVDSCRQNITVGGPSSSIDVSSQLGLMSKYGYLQTVSFQDKSIKFPMKKRAFSVKNTTYQGQNTWIDPEGQYDMKIIKVIPQLVGKLLAPSSYRQTSSINGNYSQININSSTDKNLNPLLYSSDLYSNGLYGSDAPQDIQIIYRKVNINDMAFYLGDDFYNEYYNSSFSFGSKLVGEIIQLQIDEWIQMNTYYMVEGVLTDKNTQNAANLTAANNNTQSSGGQYKYPHFITVIFPFIDIIIDIFSKLIPNIDNLYEIISNPSEFLVNIILNKLGDNNGTEAIKFEMFSLVFKQAYEKLSTMDPNNIYSFVNSSILKNYVFVDENNNYNFLLDGLSTVSLFGTEFGIEFNNLIPSIITNTGGSNEESILKFMLNMITFPIQIVKQIIDEIKKVFTSLGNPIDLFKNIKDFVSFEWIKKIFSKESLLSMAGITYDLNKFNNWASSIDTLPDDMTFDMSSVFSLDFSPSLPTYTKSEFVSMIKGYNGTNISNSLILTLKSQLVLMEKIINSIIDLIWAIFGISSIIKPPYISLSSDIGPTSIRDIMNLLDGNYGATSSDPGSASLVSSFVYTITLPNGSTITNLNYNDLQSWIESNQGIQFDFNF